MFISLDNFLHYFVTIDDTDLSSNLGDDRMRARRGQTFATFLARLSTSRNLQDGDPHIDGECKRNPAREGRVAVGPESWQSISGQEERSSGRPERANKLANRRHPASKLTI